jgi:RES domain
LLPAPSLPTHRIDPGTLLQHASRTIYRGLPLLFGKDGANRYDDPGLGYGVLYLAFDLATVLMETVFHQHRWRTRAKRTITRSEVHRRMIRAVGTASQIALADLTAPNVMAARFGLNQSQLASRRYLHTQRISTEIRALLDPTSAPLFDGILYHSHNNLPAHCVALFDRAKAKVAVIDDIELETHVDWPTFLATYRVIVTPH